MGDSDDLDLDGGDSPGIDAPKKASGLAALLPNLLKFIAIGLGALIFIVTISVITFNIMNRGGRPQTAIPINSPFTGARPTFQFFTLIGVVRTTTSDTVPHSVVVNLQLGYDENDNATATELTARLPELQDFIRSYFRSKRAIELGTTNEPRLRQEIIEQINTRILNTGRIRHVAFIQLEVMAMP